jgi:hypothetical protein
MLSYARDKDLQLMPADGGFMFLAANYLAKLSTDVGMAFVYALQYE